ncbi:tripartite tricarboxylate transporter substrate binding protein [Noviherbaspirillum sp. CPCC 100848]|uniref:Tripartite tricarboxylate transporter substrate binding protein n=1 Tax=Noviherbaspirillum album TaxID=3080276 RepID=A0ABU6JEG3_9BURK|nr:tripartite tricarboxylate transporter substrate binding protein [Noviherbaspirillum sp. CPCC 100848]MEC4721602.1 tripartite tricarboxylate transporter substrate binding protein [Noviherbaspirillum sp. CPCC 100848]
MKTTLRCTALAVAMLTMPLAHAQNKAEDYPNKAVRVILPFAPGGATDAIARTVAQKLSEKWGQPVIVDNRAGANGNIGAGQAARSPADGYSILMATSSHAINASLYKKLDYSLGKDFAALSNLAAVPLILVAHPEVPATSVKQLATYAGAQPGKLNFGSGGVGTAAHLAGELFNTASGAKMVHVAYKGGALAMNDLLGGQIQVMFANLPEAQAQVKSAKLKALAITGNQRNPQLPDVPTFAESGYKEIDLKSWFGMFAPKNTPQPIVDKLSRDIAAAVADPSVQQRLKDLGAEPIGNRHEEFQAFVNSDIERWRALVQKSGASVD